MILVYNMFSILNRMLEVKCHIRFLKLESFSQHSFFDLEFLYIY